MEHASTLDQQLVLRLYESLLGAWNNQNAIAFAAQFQDDANVVGFDGSQMNSRSQIQREIQQIFSNHQVASYVWIIEQIRQIDEQTFLLRAMVGMVPPGKKEINPQRNAIQSLVAVKKNDVFQIALFHNTPAVFDGRPELADNFTKRLENLLT